MLMIDIHTHILPHVDDGSANMETSIRLIESEVKQGVTDIFVTPHYYRFREFLSTHKQNRDLFESLMTEVKRLDIPVKLYLGNEIYYDLDTLRRLESGTVIPMGDSRYVLVEFSLTRETEDIPDAINDLTAKGYIPIIAHPERYPYIKSLQDYKIMRHMGAKIQINAGSLTGYYGKKVKSFVKKLIKNDLVDFVASDIHDFRMGFLGDAYRIVAKMFGPEKADHLFNNRDIFE